MLWHFANYLYRYIPFTISEFSISYWVLNYLFFIQLISSKDIWLKKNLTVTLTWQRFATKLLKRFQIPIHWRLIMRQCLTFFIILAHYQHEEDYIKLEQILNLLYPCAKFMTSSAKIRLVLLACKGTTMGCV